MSTASPPRATERRSTTEIEESTPEWKRRLTSDNAARVASLVSFFLLWVVMSTLFPRVPGPAEVVVRLVDEFARGEVFGNFGSTLYRFGVGVALATVVGIARAFAVEPDLLLMDEPFSHLDAITARGLRAQLQDIWAQSKKTVVFVTHDVVEAVELSDRIIVLQPGGRIFEDITIDLPRPRRQTDPTVATLQAEVLARLEAMKEMSRTAEPVA